MRASAAAAGLALVTSTASIAMPPTSELLTNRRSVLHSACGLAIFASTPVWAQEPRGSAGRVSWGPFKDLSTDEMEALNERSRSPDAGVLMDSGVRVIDLVVGTGPQPEPGSRIYCHYKVWADGFRSGPVADLSFLENRPYEWILGQPTARMPRGADEGTVGMREGGWRRLVVPSESMYGEAGLRRITKSPTGARYTGAKAPYVVKPGQPAYVDLIMVDGGSGRCEKILHPPGVSDKDASKIKSMTCSYKYEIY